jgi:hypothetical protein
VFAYFGYPRADEHDVERAVRVRLALVKAVPESSLWEADACAEQFGSDNEEFRAPNRPDLTWPDDGIAAWFDMNHSGAARTWEFCFPDEPMPVMIQVIEDRDLWRFVLPETREFALYLRSFPYDLEVWSQIDNRLSYDPNLVFGRANAIAQFYDRQVADTLPTATLKTIGKWKGVPVAHAPYAFVSDVAHSFSRGILMRRSRRWWSMPTASERGLCAQRTAART